MKNAIGLILILMAAMSISAVSAPIDNICSSALATNDSAKFNFDFIDPFGLPIFDVKLHARVGNANSDTSVTMMHFVDDPNYLNTYERTIWFPNPSGEIQFYGRVESDTLVLTQSYFNRANQFPPAPVLYAPLATDAVGDTTPGSAGPFLDLIGSAITYSDTKIFVRLNNVGGGWPTSEGFTTMYAYVFPLINPDTLQLSTIALVYASVPFLIQPGLFRINLADTSFSRIGDIQYQTSGNNLYMACNISDLVSQPEFPIWPPHAGYILTSGLTLTISSQTPALNDYIYPSAFIPQTGFLNTGSNTAPTLSNYGFDVIPNVAITPYCLYNDADNNLPVTSYIMFDRGMFRMGSPDHTYNDSSEFRTALPWPSPGIHYYYFRFSDGLATIETPRDSVIFDQNGIPESPIPAAFELSQNYPNPFNAETNIEFSLSKPSAVELNIYDITGTKVTAFYNDYRDSGIHSITWNGKNCSGQNVASLIIIN